MFLYIFTILLIVESKNGFEIIEKPGEMLVLDVVDAIRRVGRFLIQHKFFERDQRLAREYLVNEEPYFMLKFPEPPLERIPSIVISECRRGFLACLKRVDELIDYNFTRKDLFIVRTASSYYMCWYTMLMEPLLSRFFSSCQIPYEEPQLTMDYRGFDRYAFDCAYHSFCPDPCCGQINRTSTRPKAHRKFENGSYVRGTARYKSDCVFLPSYPCGFEASACEYDAKKNRNFRDLISNKFNLTCSCRRSQKGFVFDKNFKMCIDYEECKHKDHQCPPHTVCRNIKNGYYCTCAMGYKFNHSKRGCLKDDNFEFAEVLKDGGIVVEEKKEVMEEFFLIAWLRWLIELVTSLVHSENYGEMS